MDVDDKNIFDLKSAKKDSLEKLENLEKVQITGQFRARKTYQKKLDLPFDHRPISPNTKKLRPKIILIILATFLLLLTFNFFLNFKSKDFYKGNFHVQEKEELLKSNISELKFEITESQIKQELTTEINGVKTKSTSNYKTQINNSSFSKIEFRIVDLTLESLEVEVSAELCANSSINCDEIESQIRKKFETDFENIKSEELNKTFIINQNNADLQITLPSNTIYKLQKST